jgi:uncharacterized SAM-binding protein YcdF (DUF218 family)
VKKTSLMGRLLRVFTALAIGASVLLIVAALALVSDGLTDELGKADAGLVLGNTVERDGKPSARLGARLDRALALYREGYFPLVVVSGAVGKEGHDEATVMHDYLVKRGIPPDDVAVDGNGSTTYLSARNVKDLLRARGLESVLVVTQHFHIPRAKLALRRFEVSPVYSAHARIFELRDLYSVPREVVAYLHYMAKSYAVASSAIAGGWDAGEPCKVASATGC